MYYIPSLMGWFRYIQPQNAAFILHTCSMCKPHFALTTVYMKENYPWVWADDSTALSCISVDIYDNIYIWSGLRKSCKGLWGLVMLKGCGFGALHMTSREWVWLNAACVHCPLCCLDNAGNGKQAWKKYVYV